MYACMFVCMHVYMYVCKFVCVNVSICIYVYMCVYRFIPSLDGAREACILESSRIQRGSHDAVAHVAHNFEVLARCGGQCTNVLQTNIPTVRTSHAGGQRAPLGRNAAIELVEVGGSRSTPCRSRAGTLGCRGSSVARCFVQRETMRAAHWRENDSARQRLSRNARGATSGRWDDPIQTLCTDRIPSLAWQDVAQDRVWWQALEGGFVQR